MERLEACGRLGLTHLMYKFVELLYNISTISGRRICEDSTILRYGFLVRDDEEHGYWLAESCKTDCINRFS